MFPLTSPDKVLASASFKVSEAEFEELSAKNGVLPTPYLARYKWVPLTILIAYQNNNGNTMRSNRIGRLLLNCPQKSKRRLAI